MQLGQARHQRGKDVRREHLIAADRQRPRRRAATRRAPLMKSPRHAIGAIGIDQRRADAGHEDILHRTEYHEVRPHTLTGGDAAVERDQRIHHPRRAGQLRGPVRTVEFSRAMRAAAPGKIVGDMRLIVAQHIDAKHAVLEHRRNHRTQMMDAHQQRRLRRVRRDGYHGGHGHPVAPGDAVGGHHIDRGGGITHAVQELLPQGAIRCCRRQFIRRATHIPAP